MNKEIKHIETIVMKIIELNIITKDKTADYFYDSLEMNILIEFIEDIEKEINKISKYFKEKYNYVDWNFIEKEKYYDGVFGKGMKVSSIWKLSSTIHSKLYKDLMNVIMSELEEYSNLWIQRQKNISTKK